MKAWKILKQMNMMKLIEKDLDVIHSEIKSIYNDIEINTGVELLYYGVNYHFSSKGKMLRPAFMLSVNYDFGGEFETIKNFAIAIELIHNYSLIHDDLPSMDNDDFRRGQLTVHKKYDEATAILLGDFLLTKAFEYASNLVENNQDYLSIIKCINILAKNSNDFGMIGGQILDINFENLDSSEMVFKMYEYKTSALFQSSFIIPGILNKRADIDIDKLMSIGKKFGILFQIMDDISDKDEDEEIGKITLFKYYSDDKINTMVKELKNSLLFDLETLNLHKTKDLIVKLYGKK